MSRITILNGSPRKQGNTETLIESLVNGAKMHHQIEIISVSDYLINPCTGCNACHDAQGYACCQNDDMSVIMDKLMETDILVIASPIYFYGITAQLKAVIDRLHTPVRDKFPIMKTALILAGAAKIDDLFDPIVKQYQMILRFFELEDAGMVLVSGAKEKGEVSEKDLQNAYRLGKSL